MDFERSNELLQEIGTLIVNDPELGDVEWEKLAVITEIEDNGQSMSGFWYDENDKAASATPTGRELKAKLREVMQQPGKEPWKAAAIKIVRATGKITFDFDYDGEKYRVTPRSIDRLMEELRPED